MLALVPERCMHPALTKCALDHYCTILAHYASATNSHPDRLRICILVLSVLPALKCMLQALSQHFVHLVHARIIDSLTFVMLSHLTTRPGLSLAFSLDQQVLFNSGTPSTSALSGSLPQPSTTSAALDSPCNLACKLSAAFGSPWQLPLDAVWQPSAAYAAFSSLWQSPPA